MGKILGALKHLSDNKQTTGAGILALAGTALTCYAMATGGAPVDAATVAKAATGLATGLGLLAAKDARSA